MLTWSEIETRAVAFQKRWRKDPGNEKQSGTTFEKDFMSIRSNKETDFGLTLLGDKQLPKVLLYLLRERFF